MDVVNGEAPTKPQLKAMGEVKRRSKGWPCGIPTSKAMAERLVALRFAEWASPIFNYRKTVYAIRLTTEGEVLLGMYG